MNITFDDLIHLAEQSLDIVKGLAPDDEDIAKDAIYAGEPDLAIAAALDIAYDYPELYSKFPQGVKDLVRDPQYEVIQPYADQLLK